MRPFMLACLLLCLFQVEAAPLKEGDVPEPLRPWIDWVMQEESQRACPFLYNAAQTRRCAWPATLDIEADNEGAHFEQRWQVYAESFAPLPGERQRWPQAVTLDGVPVLVVERAGRPGVVLPAGMHVLRGRFDWNALPDSLVIPADTALVRLRVNGETLRDPELEPSGALWLRTRGSAVQETQGGDRLEMQVFRRVVDEHPMQVITRVELDVSGSAREVLLGSALLEGFVPMALASPLPARLEPDGRLRMQLRPGRWVVTVTARHPDWLTALTASANPAPWPGEEVWVFDARSELRLVELAGGSIVDPRQTRLPADWQALPARLMQPGQTLNIEVIRRGDPQPEPDALRLERELWLDFDGGGYTVKDRISGRMTRGWRIEAAAPLVPGRADLDGEPQFITHLPGSDALGVEVRRGELLLTADSRLDGVRGELPATGWTQDFVSVQGTLHLPPGWKLFAARGVDSAPGTWLTRWTLLDLFMVLVATLAIARLWHPGYAVVALVGLALLWHEPGAPRFVWLNILAAVALLRVLPAGRLFEAMRWYRNLSFVALLLIAIPFMIAQARLGLYPQLERPWQMAQTQPVARSAPAPQAPTESQADEVRSTGKQLMPLTGIATGVYDGSSYRLPEGYDAHARLQTGPGLPDWQWHSIPLQWNGPVRQGQTLSLTLIPPTGNLLLNLLRMLAILALAFILLRPKSGPGPFEALRRLRPAAGLLLPCLLFGGLPASEAQAQFPSQELLDELRTRLTAAPDCAPACAQSPRLSIEASDAQLLLRMEVHAEEPVAVPLPVQAREWQPASVQLNGADARALLRAADGPLWIALPAGRHQIVLQGPPPARESLSLGLPLRPGQVQTRLHGWRIDGLDDDGRPAAALRLSRVRETAASERLPRLEAGRLPAFVRIERTLQLGLDWRVDTRLRRLTPTGEALNLNVTLLSGESVVTDGLRVQDGVLAVTLAPQQHELRWQSTLAQTPSLTLEAAPETDRIEVWRVDASPLWHLEHKGLAPVHHTQADGRWLPQWQPWPGESLALSISRPEGSDGATLTIDAASLTFTPGSRASDARLALTLRSTQGGQHDVELPEGAQLQRVTIDGQVMPVRQDGRRVTLPLHPGSQNVDIEWREDRGMQSWFYTPAVGLAAQSVNLRLTVEPGRDRWVLATGGPRLGPAVLFWGVLLVIALIAAALARIGLAPLAFWQWLLLGIGLSQVHVVMGAVVVGWLLALGTRKRLQPDIGDALFNLIQLGLGLLTVVALVLLFVAVQQGLLGYPDMQIAGNGSSAWQLNWYLDRSAGELPQAWVLSVPLLAYRIAMLAWALWLAAALLGWLRWGWNCYASGGLWRRIERKPKTRTKEREKEKPATAGE
ncbi:MAG: hypothetical protein RBT51_07100 [Ectothiorhodospiraceae bacterium]|jgi:hypothetical protein|nr:hypothetical protein [Ectothiorhodospiraceae bacterium]